MIEISSVPPRKSSATFGNLLQSSEKIRKMFGDVHQAFRTSLRKSSESGRKSLESRQKHRYYYACKINRIIHGRLEIWNLSSRVHIRYLTRSLRSLVRYRREHSKINSIYLRAPMYYSLNNVHIIPCSSPSAYMALAAS